MDRARMQRLSGRTLIIGGLAACLAWGAGCGARSESPAGTPVQPEPTDGAGAGGSDPAALEMQAYENAKPVFDKHCGACHTGPARDEEHAEALEHFSMDGYPFGGDHAHEISEEIREVLGVDGETATMPPANPGAVQGEELAAVLAWADAFDKAQAARSGGDAHHGSEHGSEHEGAHEPEHGAAH